MRRFAIFLLACGLGSLTVVGQGDDANRALKARIEELTRELNARLKPKRDEEQLQVVTRSYDVGDLCSPVLDASFQPTNLVPSGYVSPEQDDPERRPTYSVDAIVGLSRWLIAPESWDRIEGADIAPRGTRIFVTTVPAVHARFPILLNQLRAFLNAQVAVEVVALPVSPETAALLAARPRELGREEAQRLRALAPLGSARLVCFDGQQVVQRHGRRRSYLADYNLKIAQKAALADPVRAELFEGCAVEVRGCLDRGGRGAILHCRLERTAVEEPVRRINTDHGPLDLPAMRLTRVQTSLWVPLDRTVVLGGGAAGGETCVFLLTAHRVQAGG
ncbi:MAG: hypothetical protein ACYTEZ_00920 [Planctomycetota bacterium]|jgi:hypothetical protein